MAILLVSPACALGAIRTDAPSTGEGVALRTHVVLALPCLALPLSAYY